MKDIFHAIFFDKYTENWIVCVNRLSVCMLACSRRPLRNKECILYWTELRCDCLCNNMCYCWSAQDVFYVLGWVCAAKLFQKIPTETFSVAPVTVGEVVFCSSASTILQCDDSVNETRTKCFIKSASIKLDLYSTVLTKKPQTVTGREK